MVKVGLITDLRDSSLECWTDAESWCGDLEDGGVLCVRRLVFLVAGIFWN